MSEKPASTSVWIPADVRDRADEIVRHLQLQPEQYGLVTRSSVIRVAIQKLYQELGMDKASHSPCT